MKKLLIVSAALLPLGLAACGSAEAPASEDGMTVPESREWTAKPDEGEAVDVTLPEAPVTMDGNQSAGGEASAPAESAD